MTNILIVLAVSLCSLPLLWAQPKTGVFNAVAQVPYVVDDFTATRQKATRELLQDGVRQAVLNLVGEELARQESKVVAARILTKADKYVLRYQINSEHNGPVSFEITGEVSIAMGVLTADLEKLGLMPPAHPLDTAPTAQDQTDFVKKRRPSSTLSSQIETGSSTDRKQLAWLVTENWTGQWLLPAARNRMATPFLISVTQEAQDYGWSITYLFQKWVTINDRGSVVLNDALDLARQSGISTVIVGRAYRSAGSGSIEVIADLNVIDVQSAQELGTLHQQVPVMSGNQQEAIMNLAMLVVPDLEQILSRDLYTYNTDLKLREGECTLVVRSLHPYASWEMIENLLARQFARPTVTAIELQADQVSVQFSGVLPGFFADLDGFKLDNGSRLHVDRLNEHECSVFVSVTEPEINDGEQTP